MFKKSIILLCCTLMLSACTNIKPISDTDENGNYILPEKQLKLTVWDLSDFSEYEKIDDTDIVSEWLTEKTNVTVSKIYGNNKKTWTDRLAQLVMDGQLPNLVNASDGEGMVQFLKLDKIKKVYKLTEEEIKTYAPNLWKKTPKKYWEYLKNKDGDIIGIPYNIPFGSDEILREYSDEDIEYINNYIVSENDIFPQKGKCLWIRDDILKDFYPESKSMEEIKNLSDDFLGEQLLDIPISSTEEYIEFMYSIGNGEYLSLSGKKVFAYGYRDEGGISDITMLTADMYGCKGYNLFTSWYHDKINFMLDDEIIHNAFKTQNQMIYDKIISGNSIYDTEKEYTAKILDGRYAIIPSGMNIDKINDYLAENDAAFRYRPFLTNISSEYTPYKTNNIFGGAVCILNNLNASQVHQVLNWINVRYSDDFASVNSWGTENMYTESKSGQRIFKNDKLNRYFILKDTDAIDDKSELKGISGGGSPLNIIPCEYNKYIPSIMYKSIPGSFDISEKFKFSPDSTHVSSLTSKPVSDITNSIYADIPEVTEFLSRKNEIETEAKRLLIKSPDDFELRWSEFIEDIYKTIDISAMEEKMTAAAYK